VSKVTAWKVQLSIVLIAMLVAFAPVYHAVCVAVASHASASATVTTMLMPDGTVMTHGIDMTHGTDMTADTGTPTASSAFAQTETGSVTATVLPTWPETGTLMGGILLIAGIVVLTVFLVKVLAQVARRIVPRRLPRVSGHPPSPAPDLAWRGPPPDLAVLCISRT